MQVIAETVNSNKVETTIRTEIKDDIFKSEETVEPSEIKGNNSIANEKTASQSENEVVKQ